MTLVIEDDVRHEKIGRLLPQVNNLIVIASSPYFPSLLHSMAKISNNTHIQCLTIDKIHRIDVELIPTLMNVSSNVGMVTFERGHFTDSLAE